MPTKIPQAKPIEVTPRAEERPDTFPRGRTCTRPGCKSVLSIYNSGPACNPCLHSKDLNLMGYSLRELMEED